MKTMGRLTTHVLDTATGKPAEAMTVDLFRVTADRQRTRLGEAVTNRDGRLPQPLLEGDGLLVGTYELEFDVAAYFRRIGLPLAEPPFLDRVTIRFSVADAAAHYHVPLLVSPWAYSTYRGS